MENSLTNFSRFTAQEKTQFCKDYITVRKLSGSIDFYELVDCKRFIGCTTVRKFSDWLEFEFGIKDVATATDEQLLKFFNYLTDTEKWQINSDGNYFLEISPLDSKSGKTENVELKSEVCHE